MWQPDHSGKILSRKTGAVHLVDQSYLVPEEILEQAGFDLFKAQLFQFKRFKAIMFRTDKFQPQEVGFTLLRRGVISFNTIGYE